MNQLEQLKKHRRALHQIPELELELPKTRAYVRRMLEKLDCQIIDLPGSSLAAFFDAGREDTIAFRSDMDALPIQEVCTHDFISTHPGRMHACGHDGHMALLLTFAQELNDYDHPLKKNVLLIFQAGEETPGGAGLICETGLLEKYQVSRIYGTHLWPLLPFGTLATRPGPLMARSSEVNIKIYGRTCHAARYQEGADALQAGVQLIQALYEAESRLPAEIFRLLRFGLMEAGQVRNAVAGQAHIEGTLRAFEEEVYWFLRNSIETEAAKAARATGTRITLSFSEGYPAVMNDEALCQEAFAQDPDLMRLEKPEMISEDFSFYQKHVPGVFFFLGTGTGIELHSAHFDFDEACLLPGLENYKRLAGLS